MSATPMKLEDALRLNGYTIDQVESPAFNITLPEGVVHVPEMILSKLTWRREEAPWLGAAFYLDKLPAFAPEYRPVLLSHILDRYADRRLGFDTADQFARAVRRWMNLELGAQSTLNIMYRTSAVDLPLTTVDLLTRTDRLELGTGTSEGTDGSTVNDSSSTTDGGTSTGSSKSRNAQSDYPQGQLAGNFDYASEASDVIASDTRTDTGTGTRTGEVSAAGTSSGTTTSSVDLEEELKQTGRSGATLMALIAEKREVALNADKLVLESFGDLMLQVFDRSEAERNTPGDLRYSSRAWGW